MRTPIVVPPPGQSFLDAEGTYWMVKSVRRATNLQGFFLVNLTHGNTPECLDGSMVLAPREFEALVRSRGLKLIAPDIANPVPYGGAEPEAPEDPVIPTRPTFPRSGSDAMR